MCYNNGGSKCSVRRHVKAVLRLNLSKFNQNISWSLRKERQRNHSIFEQSVTSSIGNIEAGFNWISMVKGRTPRSLFDRARSHVQRSSNVYKHVWIVYDTDDFPQDYINRTAELCGQSSTEETEYHAIWSNQCIEVWFLLHFSYFQSDIHRKDIGQNSVSAWHYMAWEPTQKDGKICIVSWSRTWILQFGMQENWIQSIKEEHQQCLHRGQRRMN